MLMRRVSAKDKISSGLLRGAVVSGVAAGMVAASLGGVPTSNATCLGIFGISINDGSGGHCSSSLFGFALGLGPGTSASADGFFNAAISVGTNVESIAGQGLDFLNVAANFGNATDGAASLVEADFGAFNIAANLGGNASSLHGEPIDMTVFAGGTEGNLGFGTAAINIIGNRNDVEAIGTLNAAINWGGVGFPNGSDSIVTAGDLEVPSFLGLAYNRQGPFTDQTCPSDCGNTVKATGPLALAAAINVVRRDAIQEGFGITIATQGNETGTAVTSNGSNTNVLAASGTQGNRVGLNSTGGNTNVLAASGTPKNRVRASFNATSNRAETTSPAVSVRKSVSDSIKKGAKKSSEPASKGSGTSGSGTSGSGSGGSGSGGTGGS
jgi:hypothetical protein